jgi:hypothetical protein
MRDGALRTRLLACACAYAHGLKFWSSRLNVAVTKHEYAKVRAGDGAMSVGRRMSIQRQGDMTWRPARVTERPDARDGHGFVVSLK